MKTIVFTVLLLTGSGLMLADELSDERKDTTDLARQLIPVLAVLSADQSELAQLREMYAQSHLLNRALALAEVQEFEAAAAMIRQAGEIQARPEAVAQTQEAIARIREREIAHLEQGIADDIAESRFSDAQAGITQLIALGAGREQVTRARRLLQDARLYGGLAPGQQFSDDLADLAAEGPVMVVIPSGSFMMGSPDDEKGRSANEGPRFRVTFSQGFALSQTEVTVGQFRRFVDATGFITRAERRGGADVYDPQSGRHSRRRDTNWRRDYMGDEAADNLPVIHVSWNDAHAYTQWLSDQTGRNYRLPSEAEYEYALRAGTETLYWWGEGRSDEIVENLAGDGDASSTQRRWTTAFKDYQDGHWGPAPVAAFPANPFGLHDMGGNVMSWTEDCWHDSYVRAPADGSAWVNPGCRRRVLRGGSWSATPAIARSAYRLAGNASSRDPRVGFRVVRDL